MFEIEKSYNRPQLNNTKNISLLVDTGCQAYTVYCFHFWLGLNSRYIYRDTWIFLRYHRFVLSFHYLRLILLFFDYLSFNPLLFLEALILSINKCITFHSRSHPHIWDHVSKFQILTLSIFTMAFYKVKCSTILDRYTASSELSTTQCNAECCFPDSSSGFLSLCLSLLQRFSNLAS